MSESLVSGILVESDSISSIHLKRDVKIDFYLPRNISDPSSLRLLLINDGQDLPKFQFDQQLDDLLRAKDISPLLCVGIHCGEDRKMEYGTAGIPDYKGRGAKAGEHRRFVMEELLPYIRKTYIIKSFREKYYAGFSLGGLNAFDMVWSHPLEFSRAGVFSGSLWWRLKDLKKGYNEDTDRILHKLVREGRYHPGLKFYFTTGSLDETMDRNNNGVIDSIDDTLALVEELVKKGYDPEQDISYLNFEDGSHNVETWGRAMPGFLKWLG